MSMFVLFCVASLMIGRALRAAVQEWPVGPLPHTVEPKGYLIDLTIDPSSTRFGGHVSIQAQLLTPARAIFVHGHGLKVSRARANGTFGSFPVDYVEVGPWGVARLDFPETVAPGPLTLSFDYTAELAVAADGLFHTKVADHWYAWTQFEPISARRVFPCFDEPRFKAPFTITVRSPSTARVFSNAMEVASRDENGWRTHRFAPTPPLPTYLVALGVGPFDVRSETAPPSAVRPHPVPIRIIATRGQLPRMATAARELPKILALLEKNIGVAYPYEKLDFLASPTMGGAMENAGLIIVGDVFLLMDANPPVNQLRGFAEVNTHEMTHQWFGDLVTPGWWSDLWLSESFAQWLGRKVADEWRPDLGIDAAALREVFVAMDADALGQGRSIRQPVVADEEIVGAFDEITYDKGAQVLAMFQSYLGAPAFGAGLRRYLRSYGHKSASAEDFFRSLSAAAGDASVVPALRTFTDQTGVPVVTFEQQGARVLLRQSRYRPLGIEAAATQTWRIPVCLSWNAHRNCSLLTTGSGTMRQPEGAGVLVPDLDGSGYFRFRLDESGWSRLLATAPTLSARAALAVADSLWADFTAGAVGFDRVLEAARVLSQHPDRSAATELGRRLQHLADTELLEEQLPRYRILMERIYAPRLAALGLDLHLGAYSPEAIPRQSLRESLVGLVALQARDSDVREQLCAAAVAYLRGDGGALDPSFRETALKVFVQKRGAFAVGELKSMLTRSPDPLLRDQIVAAAASADTSEGVQAALDLVFSPDLDTNESLRVLLSLAHERGARESVIQFVDLNFGRILKDLPSFARPFLLPALFENDCSMADVERADGFIRPRIPQLGGGQLELAQAREKIRLCAVLRQAKGPDIDAALSSAIVDGLSSLP